MKPEISNLKFKMKNIVYAIRSLLRKGCRGSRERFPDWENPPRLAGAFPEVGKLAAARGNVSRSGKTRRGSRERFPTWESSPRLAGPFPDVGKLAAARGNVSRLKMDN